MLVACAGEAPEIRQVFWQLNANLDPATGTTYESLSLFVNVHDADGVEDVDLEVAGTLSDPDANASPTEGLEDLGEEMTATQILEHVENSQELQTLVSQGDVDSAGVEEEPPQ